MFSWFCRHLAFDKLCSVDEQRSRPSLQVQWEVLNERKKADILFKTSSEVAACLGSGRFPVWDIYDASCCVIFHNDSTAQLCAAVHISMH